MRNFFACAAIAPAIVFSVEANSAGPRFQDYGKEQVGYAYCYWGNGSGEILVTQIEEVRWRDGILVNDDGSRVVRAQIGNYQAGVAGEFDERLGLSDRTQCEFEDTPTQSRRAPGSSYQAADGSTVHVMLHEVDARWFLPEAFAENASVRSLLTKSDGHSASKPRSAVDKPKKLAGTTAPSVNSGITISGKDDTAARLAAERVERDLQAQAEAAAINAKKAADAARNDAVTKMKLAKFLEDLKKRGAAQ